MYEYNFLVYMSICRYTVRAIYLIFLQCPNVLEESDLEEIFIIDPEHRHIILSSLSQRPNMPSIGNNCNYASC